MNDFEAGDTVVEAFRRANPVPAGTTAGRRSQPSAHALFADIVSRPPRRHRGRAFIAIAVAGAVAVAGLVVAFAHIDRDQPNPAQAVECFAAANLDARKVVRGGSADPAATCSSLWTDGTFGNGPVPNLDVCVLDGVAAVFPTGESGAACDALHLPRGQDYGSAVARFRDAVTATLNDECVGEADGRSIIQRALDQYGLSDWTIVSSSTPFGAELRCSSIAIDARARTVTLVPTVDPHATLTT